MIGVSWAGGGINPDALGKRPSDPLYYLRPAKYGAAFRLTVGPNRVKLASSPFKIRRAIIKADDSNTGTIFIEFDGSSIATGGGRVSVDTGFALYGGQGVVIDIDDLSKIIVYADRLNQLVHVMVLHDGESGTQLPPPEGPPDILIAV